MSAVFQKLFDRVSSVNWLKSPAFLPIHWLFCEELSHSLAFCAFFLGCGAGTQISGSGYLNFLAPAPTPKSFWLRLQNNLVQKIRKLVAYYLYNSLVPQNMSAEPEPKFQAPAPTIQNCLGTSFAALALLLWFLKFPLHWLPGFFSASLFSARCAKYQRLAPRAACKSSFQIVTNNCLLGCERDMETRAEFHFSWVYTFSVHVSSLRNWANHDRYRLRPSTAVELCCSSSRPQPISKCNLINYLIIRPSTLHHDGTLWNLRGVPTRPPV